MTRTAAELDVYEVAYLAGGCDRVVDTALVALVRTDRVRVHSPGELATADLTRRHPVEAAVLDAIGPSGHRSVDTIRWRLRDDARIEDVRRALQDDGLTARARWRRHRQSLPTPAGRRLVGQLRAERAAGADEWRVALDGREAMPDQALGASIFEQPKVERPVGRRTRARRRDAVADDPSLWGRETGATAIGGAAAIGFMEGGVGDGGGGF